MKRVASAQAASPARIWFDVEDLIDFADRHARPTGIQRVGFEVYRAAMADPLLRDRVGFVRHAQGERGFVEADWPQLAARFQLVTERPAEPAQEPPPVAEPSPRPAAAAVAVPARAPVVPRLRLLGRLLKRCRDVVPQRVSRPGFLFAVMQAQAGMALGRTLRITAQHRLREAGTRSLGRVRRGAARWMLMDPPPPASPVAPAPRRLAEIAERGDVLVVLGSPWFELEYAELAGYARGRLGLRLAVLVHDVIPVRRPEWVDRGTVRVYRNWYRTVLPLADLVLSNSRATAADLQKWCAEDNIALNGPVQPIPIGTGLAAPASTGSAAGAPAFPAALLRQLGRQPFVLFVSTIEARKNHLLLFRVWRRLLDEMGPERVPDLVFAGRVGWLVDDLMNQIENSRSLDGRLHVIQGLDDAALRALYDHCEFTVFPSFYEGWGLPVSESLGAGAPCICSNSTSLPEAGGTLARYFDPFDLNDATRVIRNAIEDVAGLSDWRARVKREFRPVPWSRTVSSLVEAVDAIDR